MMRADDISAGGAFPRSIPWLWVEFLALFVAVPVVVAVILPKGSLFPALFAFTAVGLFLLARTPGFDWAEIGRGWRRIDGRLVGALALLTFGVAVTVVLMTAPEALFSLPRTNPGLMLLIALFYPLLSALPQELIFRPLFFRRYAAILQRGTAALVLNAALFALAHLMFWNAIVAAMTFFGGLVFAHAYAVRGSFATAVVLHAVAGVIVFACGLGIFFYSGNVVRPF